MRGISLTKGKGKKIDEQLYREMNQLCGFVISLDMGLTESMWKSTSSVKHHVWCKKFFRAWFALIFSSMVLENHMNVVASCRKILHCFNEPCLKNTHFVLKSGIRGSECKWLKRQSFSSTVQTGSQRTVNSVQSLILKWHNHRLAVYVILTEAVKDFFRCPLSLIWLGSSKVRQRVK